VELEQAKSQDKKRLSQLESTFKDQLTERNNLLLILWTRLSALCGTDWAHDNSLINGRALPSLEAVATMLPGFTKNLLAAVKTIETMVGSFQSKVKSVEKDLWREYQTLENHLDQRTKKLDRLEAIVRNGIVTGQISPHSHTLNEAQARLARLEDAYRQLKVENHTLRAAADARRAAYAASSAEHNGGLDSPGGSPSPSVPMGPKAKASASKIPKSGSRIGLSRPVSSATTTTATPTRSASQSQHYFSQHHSHSSRQTLVAPASSAEEMGLTARSRGGSPATPGSRRVAGGGGGVREKDEDGDDTLTLPTPTQASYQGSGNNNINGGSASSALGTTTNSTSASTSTHPSSAPGSGSGQVVNTTTSLNPSSTAGAGSGGSGGGGAVGGGVIDTKWMLRLRDLEYKLKAEREGRIMDRGEAMKRINASENENAALRGDLERERERRRGGR
jgi:hypothetical protein